MKYKTAGQTVEGISVFYDQDEVIAWAKEWLQEGCRD